MFDIACVGINHFDEHIEKAFEGRQEVPYKVFIGADMVGNPNQQLGVKDRMGRGKTISMLRRGGIDVFWMMRDLWDMVVPGENFETFFPLHIQLAKENGHNFRVVSHFPLEYQLQPGWAQILEQMDYGYCFTRGGIPQLQPWSDRIKWCPQGADADTYRQLRNFDRRKFRLERMRLPDPDCFVVLNVNRNQPRKDVPATIQAFRLFKQQVMHQGGPRPVLWMHMRPDDNFGDARQIVEENGLRIDYDVVFPPYFNVGTGWTEEELNMLYNAADIFISTSVAEGFGLTCVEAGMAGCPTLVPGHTGFLQTMGALGMPYIRTRQPEVREKVSHSAVHPTDIDHMARELMGHYQHPEILRDKVEENIKNFRRTFDWDTIYNEYWAPMFETIQEDLFNTAARQEKNKDRYLFVCEEAFGDILGASRAIESLKKHDEETPIDFMCKNRFSDILVGNPYIDRHRDWNINRIFDYPPERVFYPHARIRHGNWSTGTSHLMDIQAEMIGLKPGKPCFIPEELDHLLPGILQEKKYITINTSSQGGKMLSMDKWANFIRGILVEHPDMRFVCVGGPQDLIPPGCIDMRFEPGVDPATPLSFRKMGWLQQHSFCHVGIDSGPGHSADALGIPSIIVWGWTNMYVCKPMNYSINIVPHYATVCPRMGPCHGVSPTCGINQYQRDSAMQAPCVRSLDVTIAATLVNEALHKGDEEGQKWLKSEAKKLKPIFALPPTPKQRRQATG
jgi:glycosyltransferase involved in cell wall biosynthesis/ADP-heptose:LPS heptosyltransferase